MIPMRIVFGVALAVGIASAQEPPAVHGTELTAPSATVESRTPNLLANGDFEELVGRAPAHWDLYILPESGATGEAVGLAHNGGFSAHVDMSDVHPSNPVINWSQNILADLAGKTLLVSGYVRTEEATEAALWLQCWATRPLRVIHGATTFDDSPVYGTQDWQRVEMSVPIPRGTEFVTCRAILRGRGAAWFDDIIVTVATSAAPNEKPGPAPSELSASPTPPAVLAAPDVLSLPIAETPTETGDSTRESAQAMDKRAAQAAALAAAAQMNRSLGTMLTEPEDESAPMNMASPFGTGLLGTGSTPNNSMLRWLLSPDLLPVTPLPLEEERRR